MSNVSIDAAIDIVVPMDDIAAIPGPSESDDPGINEMVT